MTNAISLCGAKTKGNGTCRNRIKGRGERCYLHAASLDAEKIFRLCIQVTEKVAAVCTVYEVLGTFSVALLISEANQESRWRISLDHQLFSE